MASLVNENAKEMEVEDEVDEESSSGEEEEESEEEESEEEEEEEEEEEDDDDDDDEKTTENAEKKGDGETPDGNAQEDKQEKEIVIKFPPPSTKLNKVGDLVYCQYGNDIFKSKILKVETRPMRRNEPACKAYFVHYQGWSKRFDAWVEEQYVYDFTDENTEMKKQIIQAVKDLKKREKEKEAEQDMIYEDLVMANSSFKKGKKRKLALLKRLKRPKKAPKKAMSEDVKKARSFNRKVRFNSRKEMDLTEYVETFNLTLSLGLKKRAVQDWEMMALDKRLMILPRKPSVRDILNDYLELKRNQLGKISGKTGNISVEKKKDSTPQGSSNIKSNGAMMMMMDGGGGGGNGSTNNNNIKNNDDSTTTTTTSTTINTTTTSTKTTTTSTNTTTVTNKTDNILEDMNNNDEKKDDPMQVYRELINGIEQLFNRALGKNLLYRIERKQYDDYMYENPNVLPADIYGVEHLLRLFIKLPMFLSMCNDMNDEEDSAKKIQAYLQSFIQFLGSTSSNKYFGTVYEKPDEEYLKVFSTQPVMAASDITAGTATTINDGKETNGSDTSSINKNAGISKSRRTKEEEMKLMDKLLSAPPPQKKAKKNNNH